MSFFQSHSCISLFKRSRQLKWVSQLIHPISQTFIFPWSTRYFVATQNYRYQDPRDLTFITEVALMTPTSTKFPDYPSPHSALRHPRGGSLNNHSQQDRLHNWHHNPSGPHSHSRNSSNFSSPMSYHPQLEDIMALGQPLNNTSPSSKKRKARHISPMTGVLAMTSMGLRDPGGLGESNDPINETLSSTTASKKVRQIRPGLPRKNNDSR